MARKLNLGGLFNNGDLTHTLSPFTEDADSKGVSSMFDNFGKSTFLKINKGAGSTVAHTLTFTTPILSKKILIKISTHECNIDEIFINGNSSNTQSDGFTSTDNTPPGGDPVVSNFTFTADSLTSVKVTYGSIFNLDAYISSFEIFIIDESDSTSFDFNDSVLTTKAWNSSRYSGKQLSAAKINRFTAGDSTYGKTPVIQNYSRNIYIGNDIVGMSSADGEAEDNSLLQFDNFSYAQTNTYITVNEDDSITLNTLNEPVEDDYSEIVGFYQAFYDDFKQGTYCKILMNDLSPKTNLRPSYPIWFNGGQFQKLLKLTPGNGSHLKYTISNNIFDYNEGSTSTGFSSTIYDETLLNEFYTGSLVGEIPFQPLRDGDDGVFPIDSVTGILSTNLDNLFTSAVNYKNNSDYKGDKRFFTSFTISGSEAPIRTTTTGSVVSTIFRSKNIAELSTAEFKSVNTADHAITFTEDTKLHQNYISINQTSDAMTPSLHGSGSVIFSQVSDTTPSLLIELNKSSELPDGTGDKPFIIIPHNLHPYIKDNLLYFLTQAGIDVGGNTSTVLTINPSNRLLK